MTIRKLEELNAFAPFPSAHHFHVYQCPRCDSAHVVLFDEHDLPIAQMTMGPDQVETLYDHSWEIFEA